MAEPITLAEAKANLRVVFDDEDDDITRMIRAARQMAEGRINRALVPTTKIVALPAFCGAVQLPGVPFVSVTSVTYRDPTTGAYQALGPALYEVDAYAEPAQLVLAFGATWPTTAPSSTAVVVEYLAGYADAASVPEPIRQWMLLAIGAFYEQRSMVNEAQTYALPDEFAKWLLQPYVVYQ
jgi:uncharacterized phiE125 gp8 family phage protein